MDIFLQVFVGFLGVSALIVVVCFLDKIGELVVALVVLLMFGVIFNWIGKMILLSLN